MSVEAISSEPASAWISCAMIFNKVDLPSPFRARFVGGAGIGDGDLYWDGEIEFGSGPTDGEMHYGKFDAGRCTLEVGYTRPTTTLYYLTNLGGCVLARWPYGHNVIDLLQKVNQKLWVPDFSYHPPHRDVLDNSPAQERLW